VNLLRRGRRYHRALAERPGRYRWVAARRVLVGVIAGAVIAAPAASAHVTVNPREAEKGGYAALAFRVPNERDNAGTVQLRVSFENVDLRSVNVKPKTGWTYEKQMRTLDEPIVTDDGEEITEVVGEITWSGGLIRPGEFEEFDVSVGPLPEDEDSVTFPAIQLYESVGGAPGEEVGWIEEAEGGEEPERPAPLLTLTDPEEEGGGAPAASAEEASGMTVENVASQDDVDGATTWGVIGLIVGLLGLAAGAIALVQGRRAAATAGSTTSSTSSSASSGDASD
jgi:periplasmic copper chaperone A